MTIGTLPEGKFSSRQSIWTRTYREHVRRDLVSGWMIYPEIEISGGRSFGWLDPINEKGAAGIFLDADRYTFLTLRLVTQQDCSGDCDPYEIVAAMGAISVEAIGSGGQLRRYGRDQGRSNC
ncbi:hypothetical protein [uncultured Sphingobium sp.]|uniref:hypothetical protein n=1 Tax=uncultured Sphingobium sp. TaxID=316087 RepID=UPI002618301D|nr:hypothetical protein [uncultured Sphingobium sp.]